MSKSKHLLDDAHRVTFINEHDEKFELIDVEGISLAIRGDETDWNYIPLFNDRFNIWSKKELLALADAIKELYA